MHAKLNIYSEHLNITYRGETFQAHIDGRITYCRDLTKSAPVRPMSEIAAMVDEVSGRKELSLALDYLKRQIEMETRH